MLQFEAVRPFRIARSPQQRIASIAVVAGLHIVVVAAVVAALNPSTIFQNKPDIHWTIVPSKFVPPPSPPILPTLRLRTPIGPVIKAIPPIVPTTTPQQQAGTTAIQPAALGGETVPSYTFVAARGIGATHTIPAYPALAIRLGEEGDVYLQLRIDDMGAVSDATVVRSSGHDALDEAAVAWVKAHWRYTPAMQRGVAIDSSAKAVVSFRLAAAR